MRVLTFNIWNYQGKWPARRAAIASIIRRERPDVVCLQETRHDFRYERGRGQGEQLAELTGYHPTWLFAHRFIPILRVDEGLTLLTLEPPPLVFVRRLARRPGGDRNHRICLGTRVKTAAGEIDVYDTHWAMDPVTRVQNAQQVDAFVRETSGNRPALLLGDLNAEPRETCIRFMVGEAEVDGLTGDWLDCWHAVHPEQRGFTYASWEPVRRIDYILGHNLPVPPERIEVVGTEPIDGVYPSDHIGIVADFSF